jgi:UDPglucose 6-dehydrogenase
VVTVGWIGLGKLGLTCALALAHNSTEDVIVHGYDVSDRPSQILEGEVEPFQEANIDQLLQANHDDPRILMNESVGDVVRAMEHGSIVFVSAQTPHSPKFGGETEPPAWETKDFEYGYLINAVREVCNEAKRQQKYIVLVVISTVLPGTSHKHLLPLTNPYVSFVYNPFFIAMGTTFRDFVEPEFVLLGGSESEALLRVTELYETVHDRPIRCMSVESAELTKVSYNTFISMKIVFANTLMEIAHKTGADVDEVTQALAAADQRIASGAYMHGGMGDGGGCHPRDNIAMQHLARGLNLSADPFFFVTDARNTQSNWLAEEVLSWKELTNLPVVISGLAYKPESNLTLGSPALLLDSQLRGKGVDAALYDPYVDHAPELQARRLGELAFNGLGPAIFFIGAKHDYHTTHKFPAGSVVLDPFGYVPDQSGVNVIRLGRKN